MKYWKTKYQLAEDLIVLIPNWPYGHIKTDLISIRPNGKGGAWLRISKYWCWDGPTMVYDSKKFMLPSCVHDVLYWLMRWGKIPIAFRPQADDLMYNLCLKSGMNKTWSGICCWAVKRFAEKCATPENRRKIHEAP